MPLGIVVKIYGLDYSGKSPILKGDRTMEQHFKEAIRILREDVDSPAKREFVKNVGSILANVKKEETRIWEEFRKKKEAIEVKRKEALEAIRTK